MTIKICCILCPKRKQHVINAVAKLIHLKSNPKFASWTIVKVGYVWLYVDIYLGHSTTQPCYIIDNVAIMFWCHVSFFYFVYICSLIKFLFILPCFFLAYDVSFSLKRWKMELEFLNYFTPSTPGNTKRFRRGCNR